jgi:cytochrome P450
VQSAAENGNVDPFEGREPSYLFLDPPDHTRLRGLVSHAFTPRRVRDLGGRIQEIVDELLDAAVPTGELEVIEELAYLVPVRVICELLGVPTADHEIFKGWSRDLARSLDPEFMIPTETRDRQMAAGLALWEYFEGLIAERTKRPGDDMLSALIGAQAAGDKLTHGELLSTLSLLLIAGHETTVNLIGNGMLQFSRFPDQWAALRRGLPGDPALARTAVEEVLRFDPPVQITGRIAMTDLVFGEDIGTPVPLPKGQQGLCLIGAANRDPAEFGPTANSFDITRTPNNHVAFGAGIHFCLGAPLAKLEAQITFETLARRIGPFELTADPSYRENFVLRGLASLPIAFNTN